MSEKSLVSIIIPCYNAEAYIKEAIDSALDQTYSPVEVIVIDDGSTDDSLEIIRSFDERITWRTGENKGVSAARNKGLELASGDFVKFLDADDLLPAYAISMQVGQIISTENEEVAVFGQSYHIDEGGNKKGKSSFRPFGENEDPILYILNVNPGTQIPLYRREHLIEIGGFDESLPWAEDYDLHLRLHLSGFLLHYRPGAIVEVRDHEDEDRLTNRKKTEFESDPMAAYRRGLDREQKIREGCPNGLSDPVQRHLAREFWTWGRQALKVGSDEAAVMYFDHARELHSDPIRSPSTIYRWCAKLLGPRLAEQLVEAVRR